MEWYFDTGIEGGKAEDVSKIILDWPARRKMVPLTNLEQERKNRFAKKDHEFGFWYLEVVCLEIAVEC